MAGSARKPYLRLKKSLVDFFRAPAVFIKRIHQKFSVFEKPYLEEEYPQMQLEWPKWDWGNWKGPKLPPQSPFSPGGVPPTSWADPPPLEEADWDFLGCAMYIFPVEVTPGGSYTIKFARGDDPIISISVEGPGTLTADSLPQCTKDAGGLCTVYLYVAEDTGDWEWITVSAETASGRSCGRVALIVGCNSTATIGYTSLQMAVSEEQTLEARVGGVLDSNTNYEWAISSGGGSLSASKGNSVTYTAPATNAECASNPTITLSCDGVVIDSATFAVTAAVEADAYLHGYCEWTWGAGRTACCYAAYNCDGTILDSASAHCLLTNWQVCCDECALCYEGGIACTERLLDAACPPAISFPDDKRTAGEITAGCCPAALL